MLAAIGVISCPRHSPQNTGNGSACMAVNQSGLKLHDHEFVPQELLAPYSAEEPRHRSELCEPCFASLCRDPVRIASIPAFRKSLCVHDPSGMEFAFTPPAPHGAGDLRKR